MAGPRSYKLCIYVPEDALETVKEAVFAAGAGRQGDYDRCCWQVRGEGQFRPLAGSDPHIGRHGEVARVAEYRVELLCPAECVGAAVAALREAHPYEEPAFDLIPLAAPPE
ncbi:MAG: NGG1p interacting factor NIF3 [Pseudomonadota bacterium]|jgi:hypothetical protein